MTSVLVDNKTPNEHTILLQPKETKSDVQRSFVHQLTEIIKTSKFTKANNGQSQLVIRLHPEHLGTLTIKLVAQKDGELAAKIITNTTAAKELIEASIHQIRHMIPTENIVVERFDVWTQNEFDGMNRNQSQQQPKQPFENEQGQAEESEPASEEFADALKEQLNTTV
jgi:flagellar hook-length control protein FliK